MLIKQGVYTDKLNKGIRRALNTIENVFKSYELEAVITSTNEGNHSASSLHYTNDAVDVRLPREFKQEIYEDIEALLGDRYDVALEVSHIHIEYDPK